jgi:hypothetical protein
MPRQTVDHAVRVQRADQKLITMREANQFLLDVLSGRKDGALINHEPFGTGRLLSGRRVLDFEMILTHGNLLFRKGLVAARPVPKRGELMSQAFSPGFCVNLHKECLWLSNAMLIRRQFYKSRRGLV